MDGQDFTERMRTAVPPDIETFTVGFEIEVLLPPPPGTAPPWDGVHDTAPPGFCRAVASALRDLTGDAYRAPSKPRPGHYGLHVLPEYDLDPLGFPDDCVAGVEIVTPPLPYERAAAVLDRLCQALGELGAGTHREVGAHIGLSHPRGISAEGLALILDEELLLNTEDRAGLRGLAVQESAFMPAAIRRLREDPDFAIHTTWLDQRLGQGKRYATNLEKLDRGYVELRHWSADTVLLGTVSTDDLIRPYLHPATANATVADDAMQHATAQAAAAAAWLARMNGRLSLRTEEDTRRAHHDSVLEKIIEVDGEGIGYYRETLRSADLSLGEGPSNPSARRRHGVDLAEVPETLAHMILQEARYRWRYERDAPLPDFLGQMLSCLDDRDAL